VAGIITPLFLIVMAQFTAVMPRYAVLVSPLIIIVAMYSVADYIDKQNHLDKKVAVFLLVVFIVFILNYGSIVEWTTFSVCPFMTATGAAA
jgi:hypothetical protein